MTDLRRLKSQVSAALLKKVSGVAGVGLPESGITIYLEQDSVGIREAVTKALESLKLTEPLHWEVVGKFKR